MTLRVSRPLFVGSYVQVTWWALGNEKEEKCATNDDCFIIRSLSLFFNK